MKPVLELLVDEAIPGHFYWTILWPGAAGELPRAVACAPGPMPSAAWATARGREALRAIQQADAQAAGVALEQPMTHHYAVVSASPY